MYFIPCKFVSLVIALTFSRWIDCCWRSHKPRFLQWFSPPKWRCGWAALIPWQVSHVPRENSGMASPLFWKARIFFSLPYLCLCYYKEDKNLLFLQESDYFSDSLLKKIMFYYIEKYSLSFEIDSSLQTNKFRFF